ncbi:peptide-methionine (R)-S-oxide reductase [Raphidocelis subcapitata]|uniref:Peptide-methionine (R)-S-oxide reductase n=1 Tax=Raphidocelis subcapitata TaxID=307507 RepID=A0A2V0P3T9_9CHLO|nr:peptide-methionine (R)-S-oxide reductase [Raphidocelis subcapitata]|eukprot:GBF94249.1 peptide-methionine (R)-S-oxide reductase [Raphidocelis subcapitata]
MQLAAVRASAGLAAGARPARRSCTTRCAAAGSGGASQQQPQQQPSPIARRVVLGGALLASAAAGAGLARAEEAADERRGEVFHTDEEWRELLPPGPYNVLRQASTERPFSSPLYGEKRRGTFVCAGCGSPLFASAAKYDSGTGWPSFFEPLPGAVDETFDKSIFFMPRTEVRCAKCKGHLGHVFDDGPAPTGQRYCMNGLAMAFQPAGDA